MTDTRILVVGAHDTGKASLLARVCDSLGGSRVDAHQASMVLPGGEALRLTCVDMAHIGTALDSADAVLALVDAGAGDAELQLQACLKLLSGPAQAKPSVLGISRVDLHPHWDTAATTTALARAGHTLPVVPFDARDAAQGLMLLDVLMSQIEAETLLPQR